MDLLQSRDYVNIDHHIDALEPSNISGWAKYRDNKKPVVLQLLINGESVGSFKADIFREDLRAIRSDGLFSFSLSPFNEIEWQQLVAKDAEVELRDMGSGKSLAKTTWHGLRPKDAKGIVTPEGHQMRINKGVFVIPLSARTNEWRRELLETASKLAINANKYGYMVCTSYGTLLGAIRESNLIGHDDDVDLMFISNQSNLFKAIKEFHDFQEYLASEGYHVTELSNGQIHARAANGHNLDIFLAWIHEGKLSLTFTVRNGVQKEDILPLRSVEINDSQLPIPQKPEALLEAIYGPDWRIPDSAFEWRRPHDVTDFFAPIHNYRRGANIDYWQKYYSRVNPNTQTSLPSQFALFTLSARATPGLIIDLGCGNARDALFFASQGIRTIGLDYAATAISENQKIAEARNLSPLAQFKQLDITNLSQSKQAIESIIDASKNDLPLCVYSRFFFHALDENAEGAALLFISQLLTRPTDYAALEFRIAQDAERTKATPSHYRRYINADQFLQKAKSVYGLKCAYRVEGTGYAIFGKDDAYVVRLLLEK